MRTLWVNISSYLFKQIYFNFLTFIYILFLLRWEQIQRYCLLIRVVKKLYKTSQTTPRNYTNVVQNRYFLSRIFIKKLQLHFECHKLVLFHYVCRPAIENIEIELFSKSFYCFVFCFKMLLHLICFCLKVYSLNVIIFFFQRYYI